MLDYVKFVDSVGWIVLEEHIVAISKSSPKILRSLLNIELSLFFTRYLIHSVLTHLGKRVPINWLRFVLVKRCDSVVFVVPELMVALHFHQSLLSIYSLKPSFEVVLGSSCEYSFHLFVPDLPLFLTCISHSLSTCLLFVIYIALNTSEVILDQNFSFCGFCLG